MKDFSKFCLSLFCFSPDGAMGGAGTEEPAAPAESGQDDGFSGEFDPDDAAEAEIAESYGKHRDFDEGDDEEDAAQAPPKEDKAADEPHQTDDADNTLIDLGDGEKLTLKQLRADRANYRNVRREMTQAKMELAELRKMQGEIPAKSAKPATQNAPAFALPADLDPDLAPIVESIGKVVLEAVGQKIAPIDRLIHDHEEAARQKELEQAEQDWEGSIDATAQHFGVNADKLHREVLKRRVYDTEAIEAVARELSKEKPTFERKPKPTPAAERKATPVVRPRVSNSLTDPGFIDRIKSKIGR